MYIKTRAFMTTMFDYLELFRESEINQMRFLDKNDINDLRRDYSIRHEVIATWQISFTQIQKTKQSAADLLALMSMFDRQKISIILLRNSINRFDFDDALTSLLSFFLVRIEIERQSFEMHRLVQLFMRKWFEINKQLSKWTKKSIRVLIAAFFSEDYKTWADYQVFLFHARDAIDHQTEDETNVTNQTQIALSLEWYLLLKDEYKTTKKVLRMSVETRERILESEHADTLISVNNLEFMLKSQDKYEEAKAMHRRALKERRRYLGQSTHTRSSVLAILGNEDEEKSDDDLVLIHFFRSLTRCFSFLRAAMSWVWMQSRLNRHILMKLAVSFLLSSSNSFWALTIKASTTSSLMRPSPPVFGLNRMLSLLFICLSDFNGFHSEAL